MTSSAIPTYDALSYVWGDPSESKLIICDGSFIRVTANLHAALLRLRHAGSPENSCYHHKPWGYSFPDIPPMWIDAFCIDQSNINERTSQVQLMGQIYSEAGRVIVWIGKENQREDGFDSTSSFGINEAGVNNG
jgi:hypothetical protein